MRIVGVCTIGQQQSPINIPLAKHLAEVSAAGGNGGKRKVGDVKFQYAQKLPDVGELNFDFEQEVDASGDVKFNFEQNVDQFGNIKFRFDQKFNQKLDRFGDIKFQYNHQTDAMIANTGHGTMQVSSTTPLPPQPPCPQAPLSPLVERSAMWHCCSMSCCPQLVAHVCVMSSPKCC